MKYVIAAFALLFVAPYPAQALGPSFSYEGRAFDASGNPLTSTAVSFRVSIRPPGFDTCVMYSEIQTLDLSATNGFFTLAVNGAGATSQVYSSVSPAFEKVFSNSSSFNFSAGDCGSAMTYTPNASDGRNLKVEISTDGGASYEALPLIAIGSVPYAINAQQVAGFGPSQLLRVGAGVSGTTELTQAMLTELHALLNGTSTKYATSSSSQGTVITPSPTQPSSIAAGSLWYDTGSSELKLYNGTASVSLLLANAASDMNTPGAIVKRDNSGGFSAASVTASLVQVGSISMTGGSLNMNNMPITNAGRVLANAGSAASPAFALAGNGGLFQPTSGNIGFATGSVERMRIEANGNVGIGTTSPTAPLNVYSTSGSPVKIQSPLAPKISFNDTSGALVGGIGSEMANPLILYGASGYSNFVVSSMGKVGIGTTSPAYLLDGRSDESATVAAVITNAMASSSAASEFRAVGDSAQMMVGVKSSVGVMSGAIGAGDAYLKSSGGSSLAIQPGTGGVLKMGTNNAERMRIDAAGNVGIGTSTPMERLMVAGNIVATGQIVGGPGQNTGGTTVNFTYGNSAVLTNPSGGAITLQSMRMGGVYRLAIASNVTARTYTFTDQEGVCMTMEFSPANGSVAIGQDALYVITPMPNNICYIQWSVY